MIRKNQENKVLRAPYNDQTPRAFGALIYAYMCACFTDCFMCVCMPCKATEEEERKEEGRKEEEGSKEEGRKEEELREEGVSRRTQCKHHRDHHHPLPGLRKEEESERCHGSP